MAAVISFLQRQVLVKRHLTVQLLSSRRFTNGQVQREEFYCRLAKSSDFEDVVKLSNGIYSGYDYIPVVFHHWLKMPNIGIMLLHAGTKLVGLSACYIVDDGRTVVRRALRILPNLRGQGLQQTIDVALNEYVRNKFPKVSRERLVAFPDLKTKAVNPWQKILEQDVLSFCVEGKPFRTGTEQLVRAENEVEIETCTKEYLSILSPSVIEKLFPNNVMVLMFGDYCPLEPVRSNIDHILRENDLHFFVEKGSVATWPRSLSHGVYAPTVDTKIWQATFYTDDPVIFEAHLLHQFKRACEVIEGKFTFFTIQDNNMTPFARRVLEDMLQLKDANVSFINGSTMKIYERDFTR